VLPSSQAIAMHVLFLGWPPALLPASRGSLSAAGTGYIISSACTRPESTTASWMPSSTMNSLASW
jgi:hypothetical protein